MKKLLITLALCLTLTGCANLKQSGEAAILADAASTSTAISLGLGAEGNLLAAPFYGHGPWPVLAFTGARIASVQYLSAKPEPERTKGLAFLDSITWGAVANNVAILVGLNFAPAIGIATGLGYWYSTSDQREFYEICAKEKMKTCTWVPPQ